MSPGLSWDLQLSSRYEAVTREIERAILSGTLRPGDSLVERDLAAVLGTSKTPVREALKVLAQRGLVQVKPYHGTTVRVIDRDTARRIFEVRLAIEPECVRLAARHHDADTIAVASMALREAEVAGRDGNLVDVALANRRFHRSLYAPCPNDLLRSMTDSVQAQVALVSASSWIVRPTWRQEADEHEAILSALCDKHLGLAIRLLRAHISSFFARLGDK
jgi:DNA-binding GntR family transcriptional regulator